MSQKDDDVKKKKPLVEKKTMPKYIRVRKYCGLTMSVIVPLRIAAPKVPPGAMRGVLHGWRRSLQSADTCTEQQHAVDPQREVPFFRAEAERPTPLIHGALLTGIGGFMAVSRTRCVLIHFAFVRICRRTCRWSLRSASPICCPTWALITFLFKTFDQRNDPCPVPVPCACGASTCTRVTVFAAREA